MGSYTAPSGTVHRLGSRIAERAAATGANFLSPEIARLAMREVAYRQPGALIDEQRLWTNLLSSAPLTFNLFGPFRLDLHLATRVIRGLCPDLADATVRAVLFEHSPGRGDESLTRDGTAWDTLISYSRPTGEQGFIAIEVKYSEAPQDGQLGLTPRHIELAAHCSLHKEPAVLTASSLRQMLREHLLAQALLDWGRYSEGRFIMVAPELNRPVQKAIAAYRRHLLPPQDGKVSFDSWTLEALIDEFRAADRSDYGDKLHRRYLDWDTVDEALEAAFAVAGRLRSAVDVPARRFVTPRNKAILRVQGRHDSAGGGGAG